MEFTKVAFSQYWIGNDNSSFSIHLPPFTWHTLLLPYKQVNNQIWIIKCKYFLNVAAFSTGTTFISILKCNHIIKLDPQNGNTFFNDLVLWAQFALMNSGTPQLYELTQTFHKKLVQGVQIFNLWTSNQKALNGCIFSKQVKVFSHWNI